MSPSSYSSSFHSFSYSHTSGLDLTSAPHSHSIDSMAAINGVNTPHVSTPSVAARVNPKLAATVTPIGHGPAMAQAALDGAASKASVKAFKEKQRNKRKMRK